MNTHEVEFCYRMRHPVGPCQPSELLPAVTLDCVEGTVLDPSMSRVVVRIAPYASMACGDRLLLSWDGLDIEGFAYQHEMVRYVTETQVGKDVVFVIKGLHVAALDGGSLEVYWTRVSAGSAEPSESARLQLSVGDARPHLLAPIVEGVISGTLDPARMPEGTLVVMQPYARMAAGDRVTLLWGADAVAASFKDSLKVEAFAVADALSFWVDGAYIAGHFGEQVVVRYRVEDSYGAVRESEVTKLLVTPFVRGDLDAPDVLEAQDGVLDSEDSVDGVTIVIGNALTQEGELVYLKCDGELFNHRDDREITRETAGKPLIFIVPHRFWREHHGTTVRVAYVVERLDDISQESTATQVRVEA
ncbi:hypothetical protein [Pseudomonas retamae]|uniref:Uncharacterized protein n=1 Tax=Pseudomonas retamae TaxID=702110 RepID=A0ABW7D5Q2_9PSED